MSSSYSSTQNTGNLVEIIEKIPEMGVPSKVTITFLEGLGYKSKNDRSIIPVLKSLNLLDSKGEPTNEWSQLRDKSKGKRILAGLIKKSYSELFNIYPNAHAQSPENLTNFFSSKTKVGVASLRNITNTFQNLCKIAEFDPEIEEEVSLHKHQDSLTSQKRINKTIHSPTVGNSQIHFNIQVHLPGEQTSEIYEAIFKNLGKYVLGISENS